MIEVFVIIALVALLGWQEWNNRKERAKMLNAIVGKNAGEIASLDLADKTEITAKTEPKPDVVEMTNLPDEDFDKIIKGQNE
jgi:predicted negative regulator of RcsB-dependent stress response